MVMDSGFDQISSPLVESKFATPRIVKNARTGQAYSSGIGIPAETYQKESGTIFPPNKPHFFVTDSFKLLQEGKLNEPLVDSHDVSVLYMHGNVKNGQWVPQDPNLKKKGITIEDIVNDFESSGDKAVDAVLVCSDKNPDRVKAVPFSGVYEKPKIYMKDKPAHVNVTIDPQTGAINTTMRVESEDDIEYKRWKNWGHVKVQPE